MFLKNIPAKIVILVYTHENISTQVLPLVSEQLAGNLQKNM
jgi:hypothetical protein